MTGKITHGMKQQKPGFWYREMDTEIVVALIGGSFLVLVALIGKIGSDNKKDHGQVHQTLGRIEEKIDNHVENHR